MRKKTEQVVECVNLAEERIAQQTSEYCFESLLDRGVLINVTAWVTRQMLFPGADEQVELVLTVRLWSVVRRIPESLTFFETVRGRGHTILWNAAWVLARAQRYGHDFAVFVLPLPTSEEEEDAKLLRIEFAHGADGRPRVIIGLAEEFPLTSSRG